MLPTASGLPPSRLATVPPYHPVVALFNNNGINKLEQTTPTAKATEAAAGLIFPPPSVLVDIDTRLYSVIASVCRPNNLVSTVVGYDVLCLGRASERPEPTPAQQEVLPIRLIIRLRRGNSLGADWATCTQMAHACRQALQEKGISDVHCLIFESDLVTRTRDVQSNYSGCIGTIASSFSSQTDSSSPSSSFVPFELRDRDWETHYLEPRLVLRLTDKIGQLISPCDNPTKFGSTGLFIRLGSTSSGSGYQSSTGTQEQTDLLTNRLVVCPDGVTKDIGRPNHPEEDHGGCSHNNTKAAAPETIDMIQPGIVEFREVMDELERAISQKQKYINEKRPLYNHGGQDMAGRLGPSIRYTKTLRELEGLQKFQRYCHARSSSTTRRVGPVAFSPALSIRNKSRRDWALISSAYQGANSNCIFDLGSKDKDLLLERVRPEFPVTVEGHTNDEDAAPDFINLEGVCGRETIDQNYTIPYLPDGAIKAGASDEDTAEDHEFLVYKYGATTGSTCGALKSFSSRHVDQVEGIFTDYCIIGSDKDFSAKGDSGSAVFGLLPIPIADSSDGSNRVLKRQGEDDGGPCRKVTAAKHCCTPAAIGIIWGGHESLRSAPHDDVTYVIPIRDILDDIKEYTGRPVVGLKRYRSEP